MNPPIHGKETKREETEKKNYRVDNETGNYIISVAKLISMNTLQSIRKTWLKLDALTTHQIKYNEGYSLNRAPIS